MKKISIILAAIFIISVSTVEAQGVVLPSDLKVGNTGQNVTVLQNSLIALGYDIPAISSGGVAKGIFGAQTRAAVQKYQKAKGLPSTGFVGPLTRAELASATVSVSGTTPPTAKTPTTPVYNTPGSITTPGVAGTLAFSLQSTPSNGTSLDKGQSADVVRYKLQAGASDMSVSSLALDFDKRLWLTIGSITVKDDSGAVIAQKSGLTQNDFTELTVGTSYRLYVPVSNYIVPKAATRYFTINLTALGITDQSAATVTIAKAQIRSVDGTGVTDTQTEDSDRTYAFTGSNNGVVVITSNYQTPPNMLVPISLSTKTQNVILGIADFKSQGKDSVLRSMTLYLNTNRDATVNSTTVFSDMKIQSGNLLYSADSFVYDPAGSTVQFSNMAIPLPKDQKVPVAIMVDVNKDTNHALDGIAASSTLIASGTAGGTSNNPVVEDSTFTTVDINDAPLATSDITFSASNSGVDYEKPPVATLGSPVINNNSVVRYPMSFSFTLIGGDDTLYVSKVSSAALATTSTGLPSSSSAQLSDVIASPGSMSEDSTGYYVIPAGSSRKFTYSGFVSNTGGTSGLKTFQITGINYGTSTSALSANTVVYYNYAALKVTPVF